MQALVWILRFLIVLVLVWFAVKNHDLVKVHGLPGQFWEAPLVFVMLVVFVGGVIIGLLAWIPTVVRQRREIARMKKSAVQSSAIASITPPPQVEPAGTDIHGI